MLTIIAVALGIFGIGVVIGFVYGTYFEHN